MNRVFTTDLADTSTAEFKALSEEIVKLVSKIYPYDFSYASFKPLYMYHDFNVIHGKYNMTLYCAILGMILNIQKNPLSK